MRYCRMSGEVILTKSLDFLTPEINVLFARLRENITEIEREQIYQKIVSKEMENERAN